MRITTPESALGPDREEGTPLGDRLSRLFSASGIFPLGAFVVLHLTLNAEALRSGSAFAKAVGAFDRLPLVVFAEWLLVAAPLAFHGALGVWLIVGRRTLARPSPYPRAVRRAMQVTGALTVAFLAMHLAEVRFGSLGARPDGDTLATVLDADLSATWHGVPFWGVAYLIGTASVSFHFVCGLWGTFVTTYAGRALATHRTWAAWGATVAGLAIWLAFADVVVLRATGTKLFGAAVTEPLPSSGVICPAASP